MGRGWGADIKDRPHTRGKTMRPMGHPRSGCFTTLLAALAILLGAKP